MKIVLIFVGMAAVLSGTVAFIGLSPENKELLSTKADVLYDNFMAHPWPMIAAVSTFIVTVAIQKMRGGTLAEAVQQAVTKVKVVSVPTSVESEVVAKAKKKALRSQLIQDQILLQNRMRKLPSLLDTAEKDASWADKNLAEARDNLMARQKQHADAHATLDALYEERKTSEIEHKLMQEEIDQLSKE